LVRVRRAASLSILLLCGLCYARTRQTAGASFSIDLDKPFADVVNVVNEVARTASIKGTFEYRDQEQLDGAQFQEKPQLFPPWSEPGKVFVQGSHQSLSHIAGPIFVSDL
jgi:hypothetical protein